MTEITMDDIKALAKSAIAMDDLKALAKHINPDGLNTKPASPAQPFNISDHVNFPNFINRESIAAFQSQSDIRDNKKVIRRIQGMSDKVSVPPPPSSVFQQLRLELPNFEEPISFLEAQAVLRRRVPGQPAMGAQPVLLLGDPGLGKSYFAQRFTELAGIEFHEVDVASMSASFELVGSSPSWDKAKSGRVFEALATGNTLNPVFLLDEVDKAQESNYPVANALFRLLAPTQMKRYQDEYMAPLSIDASGIIWILTANDISTIHPALIDRCRVFHIDAPSPEQGRAIVMSVWQKLRLQHDFIETFEPPSEDVADALSTRVPRQIEKALLDALANAAVNGRSFVEVADIPSVSRKMKFGF